MEGSENRQSVQETEDLVVSSEPALDREQAMADILAQRSKFMTAPQYKSTLQNKCNRFMRPTKNGNLAVAKLDTDESHTVEK